MLSFDRAAHAKTFASRSQMTGKNARQWGMRQRGTLVPGFAADLVLFDLDALTTIEELGNEYRRDVPGEQSRERRSAASRPGAALPLCLLANVVCRPQGTTARRAASSWCG